MVPNLELRKQGQWVGRTKPRGEASLSKDFLIQSMSSQSRTVPEVSVGVLLTYWQFKERVENLVIEILSLFFSNLNIKDDSPPQSTWTLSSPTPNILHFGLYSLI